MEVKRTADGFTATFTAAEMRRRGGDLAAHAKPLTIKWHRDLSIASMTPFWDNLQPYEQRDPSKETAREFWDRIAAKTNAVDTAINRAEHTIREKYVLPDFTRKENPMSSKKPTAAQLAARKRFAEMAKAGVFTKKRAKNPAKRPAKPVGRVSQATGKRPSARLVKRRKATAKAPPGFFANPVDVGELRRSGSAGVKVSESVLKARLATLAKLIKAPAWDVGNMSASIGAVGLSKAYGGYMLVQLTGALGGESDLSDRMSAREMLAFLDGAILVAHAVK